MERVCGKQRGTTKGFMVVRLVVLATLVGLAELLPKRAHAARTSLRVETGALLRGPEVVRRTSDRRAWCRPGEPPSRVKPPPALELMHPTAPSTDQPMERQLSATLGNVVG